MDLGLSGNFDEWPRLIGGVAVLLTPILNPEGVAGAAARLPGRRLIEGLLRRHRGSAMAARAAGGGAAPERPAAPELTAGKRSASLEVEEVTVSFGGGQ